MTAKELINNSDIIDWWQKEDLYDLLNKYPEIEIATREQLEEFAQKRYWDVQVLYLWMKQIGLNQKLIKLTCF